MSNTQEIVPSEGNPVLSQAKMSFIIANKKPSFRQLEEDYGIPKSTLNDICTKECWELQRDEYQKSIIDVSESNIKKAVLKQRSKKIVAITTIFDKGVNKLIEKIDRDEYTITPKDLNTLARLTEFLSGEVEERKQKTFVLDKPLEDYTLAELKEMQNRAIEGQNKIIDADFEVNEDEDENECESKDDNFVPVDVSHDCVDCEDYDISADNLEDE